MESRRLKEKQEEKKLFTNKYETASLKNRPSMARPGPRDGRFTL